VVAVRTFTSMEALPAMTCASWISGGAAKASAESPIQAVESTVT
jgi:hypothetical protein